MRRFRDALFMLVALSTVGCKESPASVANATSPGGDHMVFRPASLRIATKGSPASFSGSVMITPLFATTDHTLASGASVTFDPGARSAWHTHPAGQTLVVTAGVGWVQEWGGPKRELKPGDVVWTPPGIKHWHGATVAEGMTHIAIQEHVRGTVVNWLEQVSEEQYRN